MALSIAHRRAMMGRLTRRLGGLFFCTAGLFLLAADAPLADRAGQPAEPKPAAAPVQMGRLIRVPLPIAGNADTQVKQAIQKALADLPVKGTRPVLVFEFSSAQNQFAQGSDFGRALVLARYLSSREVSSVKTVAYIPKALKGHAVLTAMACEEIIMAPDAQIGDAGIDEPA